MLSLAISPSIGSLQVRSGLRCRESSPVFFLNRFRLSRRRFVIVSASPGNTGDGREEHSWSNSNRVPEPFSGWSGSENWGGGNSQEKGGRGGKLGAGLAGILILGGLTFITLSLRGKTSRITSGLGVEQQMKPLTTEQEVLLTSDDQSTEIEQVGNDTSAISPDRGNKIGINKDPFPSLEICDVTEDKHDFINHLEVISTEILELTGDDIGSVDSFSQTLSEDQKNTDVIDSSVPSDSNPSALDGLYENNSTDLISDDLNTMESQSTIFPVTTNSVFSHNENEQITHNFDSLSLNKDISSEYVSGTNDGSINYVRSQFSPNGVKENVAFVSMGDNLQDGGLLQLSLERVTLGQAEYTAANIVSSGINSGSDLGQNEVMFSADSNNTVEGYKLDEINSIAYSVPLYANNTINDSIISTHNQNNKDSAFESILPQKSLSFTGVPAPSLVSSALEVPPGKILVPAVVDLVQSQALAALQVLKVIEANAQPGDLCTRREYARWLVSASSALSRNAASKLHPAMYIENITELAFDDVNAEDPDFSCIQGLAEAGIICSKLSLSDMGGPSMQSQDPLFFSPESPVSRQDLVSWKMALERKQLTEADKTHLYQISGFIDIDKIDSGAWPALIADLSSGEQSIISLAFGYTRLFQPNKPVTKAQAAIALATGEAAEIVGEELTRIEAESLAEAAVNAHTALVAQVEKDLNASFEQELAKEREKIDAVEKLAEEARQELERIRAEREEENNAILRGQAAVKSEMELISRLKSEVEDQLQELMSNKVELSFDRERISKLRKEIESENESVVQLQYELEVERKALSMARTWAEEEAKRARELARDLEEARERWMKNGIKVVVDEDLQADASTGITWATAGEQAPIDETIVRGETLVEKLKAMANEITSKPSAVIENMIHKIVGIISALRRKASESLMHAAELRGKAAMNASRTVESLKENASATSSNIALRARRAVDDCKEGVKKISVKFKA